MNSLLTNKFYYPETSFPTFAWIMCEKMVIISEEEYFYIQKE